MAHATSIDDSRKLQAMLVESWPSFDGTSLPLGLAKSG
eukprot:CAMPEP_0172820292 /NCGR_PEP_ID=MMETSP1075-20121228/15164_1 /TAXON_ID=2916 /ORGANISM="Ceratium fusus, Strain PA161109" /LENGTH=37 /DNA_ID= /DNA_START= /DNA_END= /DNA_ORIENTATION=